MKKIKFSELCELIKKGKQPKKIRTYLNGKRATSWEWSEKKNDYTDGMFYMTDLHTLLGLAELKVQYEEEVLDDVEKAYLSGIIKPANIKRNVMYICKVECGKTEFICIDLGTEQIILPNFRRGTMYKGMEPNKEYTLKELGL